MSKRKLVLAVLLLAQCSCSNSKRIFVASKSPSGKDIAIFDLDYPYSSFMNIGQWHTVVEKPLFDRGLFARQVTTFWVGWPKEGSYFSLLVCSYPLITTLERISFKDLNDQRGSDQVDFSESDRNLFMSLRLQFEKDDRVKKAKSDRRVSITLRHLVKEFSVYSFVLSGWAGRTGLLIQTAVGSGNGLGGFETKRSGCA